MHSALLTLYWWFLWATMTNDISHAIATLRTLENTQNETTEKHEQELFTMIVEDFSHRIKR